MVHTPHWTGDPDTFVSSLFGWMKITGRICRCGSETALSRSLCVADRALSQGASHSDVSAGLLHTVGLLLVCSDLTCETASVRSRSHEIGARWLSAVFPFAVAEPIRLQPEARRWLFAADKSFRDCLSDDAMREMAIEGGPMVQSERQAFETRKGFQAAIDLARRIEWSRTQSCAHWSPDDLILFRSPVIACLGGTLADTNRTAIAETMHTEPMHSEPIQNQTGRFF